MALDIIVPSIAVKLERVVGFFNTYRQLYPMSRHVLRDIVEQFQR